jgi:hypothetical protein
LLWLPTENISPHRSVVLNTPTIIIIPFLTDHPKD